MQLFSRLLKKWQTKPSIKMILNIFSEKNTYYSTIRSKLQPHIFLMHTKISTKVRYFSARNFKSNASSKQFIYIIFFTCLSLLLFVFALLNIV